MYFVKLLCSVLLVMFQEQPILCNGLERLRVVHSALNQQRVLKRLQKEASPKHIDQRKCSSVVTRTPS
eukprot:5893725-Amphidinium_carterae.1